MSALFIITKKGCERIPVLTIGVKSFYFRSAYLLYYFDVHQLMQQEIPNIPQSEINKRISENWKRLSVAEKAYYLEKAKSEKEGMDGVSVIFSVLLVQMTSSEGVSLRNDEVIRCVCVMRCNILKQ